MTETILFDLYSLNTDGVITNIKTGYTLNPTFNTIHNRYKVNLSVFGKKTSFYLHKLIATTFIPDYKETDEIRFIDDDPMNCKLSNISIYRLQKIYPIEGCSDNA